MEILVALGLALLFGGLALMALCVAFFVTVWLVALIAIAIRALYRAVTR
jgi:hypothetical protein